MDVLRWALLEWDVKWKDPFANFKIVEKILPQLRDYTDIVSMPEMFATGFVRDPSDIADTPDGVIVSWLKEKANEFQLCLTGTAAIKDGDLIYNRLIFVTPYGKLFTYDKKHLFRMAGEHKKYGSGSQSTIFNYHDWKIKPLICYDLRFPVWARNKFVNNEYEYDILFYPANWPTSRIHIWETLLKARSIENMAITIGINRTGVDGNGWEYCGKSTACFPDGTELDALVLKSDDITAKIYSLNYNALKQFRESFPVALDWDSFSIINT
ncbi:MAG: nitrilase family protein [Bacteroidales bacterium]|nr:nitrilase family protein [Bacteroidales bacterium]